AERESGTGLRGESRRGALAAGPVAATEAEAAPGGDRGGRPPDPPARRLPRLRRLRLASPATGREPRAGEGDGHPGRGGGVPRPDSRDGRAAAIRRGSRVLEPAT